MIDGNPSAFPMFGEDCFAEGMTLRDYMAGQALTGLLAGNQVTGFDADVSVYEAVCDQAYGIANKMLEARNSETE